MRIFLLLLVIAMTGCSLLMEKPEVAVKSVNLTGLDRKGVELEFVLAVANPNSYTLSLTGYSYNLLVSAIPLARGESREAVEFAGKAATDMRLPVRLSFRDLLQIISKSPDPDHLSYRLNAGLNLRTPYGPLAVPVDKQGTFTVPGQYHPSRFMKQINEFLKKE
jgi:LEA14-like dessication related protein